MRQYAGLTPKSQWAHLYAAIREGKPFPIETSDAIQVMEIISRARQGTPFAQ
jgi:hypothetical protein